MLSDCLPDKLFRLIARVEVALSLRNMKAVLHDIDAGKGLVDKVLVALLAFPERLLSRFRSVMSSPELKVPMISPVPSLMTVLFQAMIFLRPPASISNSQIVQRVQILHSSIA